MGRMGHVNRRDALWAIDPNCHWCGRATFVPSGIDGSAPAPLEATLDHLISRGMGRKGSDLKRTVLACHQCNQARNSAEMKGKDWLCLGVSPKGHPVYQFSDPVSIGQAILEEALRG